MHKEKKGALFLSVTGVWTQGFALAKKCLRHSSGSFWSGYFRDGISHTIYWGWPWTEILMISTFQVLIVSFKKLKVFHYVFDEIEFFYCAFSVKLEHLCLVLKISDQ
jgi:hypothetical protein